MIRDIIDGFLGYFRAYQDLNKYGLWRYVIISGLISVVLASGFLILIAKNFDDMGAWVGDMYIWDTGKEIFQTIVSVLSSTLLIISAMLGFKYIILIIVSPIMSLVSERVEKQIVDAPAESPSFDLKSIYRGIRLSISNIIRELGLVLLLLIASLFPLAGVATAPAIFVVQSYYAGFGNMDYTMERYYNIKEARSFVSKNKGIAIGNGIAYMLLLMIPIIGVFFAPTLATVASTKAVCKRMAVKTIS